MIRVFIFSLILLSYNSALAADKIYWSFNSNSNTRKSSECSKLKESELNSLIKEMGCLKVFSSGILFCSEKRVLYLFPDEKQCVAHQKQVVL